MVDNRKAQSLPRRADSLRRGSTFNHQLNLVDQNVIRSDVIGETNPDIYDSHDYTQDPVELKNRHVGLESGDPYINPGNRGHAQSLPYRGQPYFLSEFDGIKWAPGTADDHSKSWGYGEAPQSVAEFHARFAGQCSVLLENSSMFGYCYTQLTDVFQEQNGLYAFDRAEKFDLAPIRAAQERAAAIESGERHQLRPL